MCRSHTKEGEMFWEKRNLLPEKVKEEYFQRTHHMEPRLEKKWRGCKILLGEISRQRWGERRTSGDNGQFLHSAYYLFFPDQGSRKRPRWPQQKSKQLEPKTYFAIKTNCHEVSTSKKPGTGAFKSGKSHKTNHPTKCKLGQIHYFQFRREWGDKWNLWKLK